MNQPVSSSTPTSQTEWQALTTNLTLEGRAYLNGAYQWAASGETFTSVSPVDGRELAAIASCDQSDADQAVMAARAAFEAGIWSQLAPAKRKAVLLRFADLIEVHGDELALLETLDMGKPISHARTVDVPATARAIRWTAEAIDKVYGELAPTPHNQIGMISRAYGWSRLPCALELSDDHGGLENRPGPGHRQFCDSQTFREIAPERYSTGRPGRGSRRSLRRFQRAAGLRPHGGQSPGPAHGCGLPGVYRVHECRQTADDLCWPVQHETGVAGGRWQEPEHCLCRCAGPEKAASEAASAIAFNQGEVCTAGSRLLVENSIRAEFIELIREALKTWRPGHPLDPATTCGAIVDQGQLDRIIDYIGIGQSEGARLVEGGQRIMEDTGGLFVQPTVFDGVNNQMRIASEEIFGPVLSVIGFDTADEAIRIANDSIYGLAAAVWTSNINTAHKVAKALRAGSVWINHYDGGDMTAPFGGFKQSGNGRDKSVHAFDKYTEVKATWLVLE